MSLNHDPNPGPSLLPTAASMHSDKKKHLSESTHVSSTAEGTEIATAASESHSQPRHQGESCSSPCDTIESSSDTLLSSVTDQPEPALSRNAAAIRIQSAVRGYSARRRLQPYIQKHRAATVIQAAWYVCMCVCMYVCEGTCSVASYRHIGTLVVFRGF